MFEELCSFDRIVVSGPQRSGTTICAQMIAHDTGYRFVDERSFDVYNHEKWLSFLHHSGVVVQCPTMSAYLHRIDACPLLIVWMLRPLSEILLSQERIGWGQFASIERLNYPVHDHNIPIASIKQSYWDSVQKHRVPNYREIQYHSLSAHPLWVPAHDRVDFTPKQTRPPYAYRR